MKVAVIADNTAGDLNGRFVEYVVKPDGTQEFKIEGTDIILSINKYYELYNNGHLKILHTPSPQEDHQEKLEYLYGVMSKAGESHLIAGFKRNNTNKIIRNTILKWILSGVVIIFLIIVLIVAVLNNWIDTSLVYETYKTIITEFSKLAEIEQLF